MLVSELLIGRGILLISVYLGNGYVIHRWGDHDGIGKSVGFFGNFLTFSGTQFDKATILQSKISDVMKLGGQVKVNNYLDKTCKYVQIRKKKISINQSRVSDRRKILFYYIEKQNQFVLMPTR